MENSSTLNKLKCQITTDAPDFAKYFKFFVKETSNEYYNLAMDRWYNAEDGNIWLSFASADRNKVDEETFIILKKKHDTHEPVIDPARYKIIAIKNDAPDFVKTNIKLLGMAKNNTNKTDIGTSSIGFPFQNYSALWIRESATEMQDILNGAGDIAKKISDGTIPVRGRTSSIKSEWYQVTTWAPTSATGEFHKLKVDKPFGEDVEFATLDGSFTNIADDLRIEFSDHKVENKKEFEGRFFVKIHKDLVLLQNLLIPLEKDYRVVNARPIHYFNIPQHHSDDIFFSDKHVDWEAVALNVNAELDDNGGAAEYHNPDFGVNYSGDYTSEDAKYFFYHPAGLNNGEINTTCAAREGVLYWHMRSQQRFFIDSMWVRGHKADCDSGTCCKRDKSCFHHTRGKGIHGDGTGLKMDIGYIFPYEYYWTSTEDEDFYKRMTTIGTTFRFREDPDDLVYIVTGGDRWEGREGHDITVSTDPDEPLVTVEHQHYCMLHTAHRTTDTSKKNTGPGNNRVRFGVSFERLDLPGVGFGMGPSGYHVTGHKATTKYPNQEELGYWGGRQGSQHWHLSGGGNDSGPYVRYSPTPKNYQYSSVAATTSSGNNQYYDEVGDLVDGASGITQAKRWRRHAQKYHHIEIVEEYSANDNDWSSPNPATWETEPKEDVGMDIYYEASSAIPTSINAATNELFAPIGSIVDRDYSPPYPAETTVVSWSDNVVTLSNIIQVKQGD